MRLYLISVICMTLSSAGVAHSSDYRLEGYACCNLHFINNENWISDRNYTSQAFVPAGAPVKVRQGGRTYRTAAEIFGAEYWFGIEDSYQVESLDNWLRRIVVQENPKAKIDSWPQEIRHAVRLGKIRLGMTREQVMVALGPPVKVKNINHDAPFWLYQHTSNADTEYAVHFVDDVVSKVTHKITTVPDVLENGRIEVVY